MERFKYSAQLTNFQERIKHFSLFIFNQMVNISEIELFPTNFPGIPDERPHTDIFHEFICTCCKKSIYQKKALEL
jgi:hypothetical protein